MKNIVGDSYDRIYAIDGSKTSMVTQNALQPKVGMMFSTLYDVNNMIPIDVKLVEHYDERSIITEQHLEYIEENSIVLMDRGYFSKALA